MLITYWKREKKEKEYFQVNSKYFSEKYRNTFVLLLRQLHYEQVYISKVDTDSTVLWYIILTLRTFYLVFL